MTSSNDNTFSARVDNGHITVTADGSKLANGDYVCEHLYHPKRVQMQNTQAKLDQLKTWLTITFEYGEPPHNEDSPMTLAYKLYKDDETKDAVLKLMEWLEDPKT